MVGVATSAARASACAAAVLVARATVLVPPLDRAACDAATNAADTTVFAAVQVLVRVSAVSGTAFDASTNVADTAAFVVLPVPSLAVFAGIRAEAALDIASAQYPPTMPCTGRRTGTGRERAGASAGPLCRTRCRQRSSRTMRPACSPSLC